jgi:hypothetical protein
MQYLSSNLFNEYQDVICLALFQEELIRKGVKEVTSLYTNDTQRRYLNYGAF